MRTRYTGSTSENPQAAFTHASPTSENPQPHLHMQVEDRKRPNLHPDRARGIDRREQLRKFFQAVSAAELKKGVRAVDLAEGTKPEMVGALVDYFAAKRRRGNAVLLAGLAAGGAGAEEEQEAAL